MTTYTWIGPAGYWSDAADWSGGPNPPPNDASSAVYIEGSYGVYGYTVAIPSGESFQTGSVTLANASTQQTGTILELDGTAALTVWGSFANDTNYLGGLELDNASTLTVTGDFSNTGYVTVDNNPGDGGASLTVDGTFYNGGAVQIGPNDYSLGAAATVWLGGLVNDSGASFQVTGSPTHAASLTFGFFGTGFTENFGEFGLSYVAPVTLYNGFTNYSSGSFDLDETALTVMGAFNNAGNVSLDAGGNGGGGSLTIGGTLSNGGAVQVGPVDNSLSAAATLTLGGLVNDSGATFDMYGSPTNAATLAFSAGGTGFTFNSGAVDLSYIAPLTLNNEFTNETTGSFELDGTSALTVTGAFFNGGALSLNPNSYDGGGKLTIGGVLYNSGTLQVGPADYSLGAATTLTLGGLVNYSGASFDMSGSSPTQAATLTFSAGETGFTSNSGKVDLSYVAPLTLNNSFDNWGGGQFELDGTSALYETGDFYNGGALLLDPNTFDGGGHLYVGGTLTNDGSIAVGPSNGSLGAATTVTLGRFYNDSGATFSADGSASHSATVYATDLTSNSGQLDLGSHAVFLVSGGYASFDETSTGTFNEAAGANFNISAGDVATFDGGANLSGKVSGAGTLALAGGGVTVIGAGAALPVAHWSISGGATVTAVDLNENLTYAETLSAGAGTTFNLSGGNLTLTGQDSFSGAATAGGGSHVLSVKGTTTVSALTIGGTTTFDNFKTLTESGGAVTLGDAAGDIARLINASTGTWDILDNSGISRGKSTSSSISNSGLIEKAGGTGVSDITPRVVNNGQVLVSSGVLDFQNAASGTGTDTISGASTLEFDSTVASGQTIGLTGGGELDLIDPHAFGGQISGFAATDSIALFGDWSLAGFSENAGGTLGTLALSNGGITHAFNFVGNFTAADFHIASGATTFVTHT